MKKVRKLLLSILIALLAVTVIQETVPLMSAQSVQAASVKLNKTTLILVKDQSYQLKLKGTTRKAKWYTSKSSVVSVTQQGKITAKKKGTATITAKISSQKYTCKVTVETPKLSASSLRIEVGEARALTLSGTKQKIKWYSVDEKTAAVSPNGVVTGKKAGRTTIVAKIGSRKFNCYVAVHDKAKEGPKQEKYNDALKVLKENIMKYGKRAENGDWYFAEEVDNEDDDEANYYYDDMYQIRYEAQKDRFSFKLIQLGDGWGQTVVSMYVDQWVNKPVYPRFYTMFEDDDSVYKSYAKMSRSSYSIKNMVNFTVERKEKPGDIQNISNLFLRWAFLNWDRMLKTKAGIGMKDLGFVSFEGYEGLTRQDIGFRSYEED